MNLKNELDKFYFSTAICDLKLMNEQYIDRDLSYNTFLYLEVIFSMKGYCTVSRLSELLNVSKSAVTSKVNELILHGLVSKTQDLNDKRVWRLKVNEDVLPKYRIYDMQDKLALTKIEEEFSEEDIQKFCQMLRIISDINYIELDGDINGIIKYEKLLREFKIK